MSRDQRVLSLERPIATAVLPTPHNLGFLARVPGVGQITLAISMDARAVPQRMPVELGRTTQVHGLGILFNFRILSHSTVQHIVTHAL